MNVNHTKRNIFATTLFAGVMPLAGCDSGSPTQTPAILATATVLTQPTTVVPTSTVATSSSDPAPIPTTENVPTVDVPPTATVVALSTSEAAPTETVVSSPTPGSAPQTSAADCTLRNLNSVTEAELMATMPGFSSRMVREFMEYSPYASIQQFRKEIGKYVDDATVAEYEKYVYVTVDYNSSDAATLQQIPGVSRAVAANIIAARPYASSASFLDAMGKQISAEQLSVAGCYMAANP